MAKTGIALLGVCEILSSMAAMSRDADSDRSFSPFLRATNRARWSCFAVCLMLTTTAFDVFAQSEEDEAPEADIGFAAEAVPDAAEFEIRELTFRTVEGAPTIDGVVDEPFWQQAESFDLTMELYPTRFAPAVVETRAFVASGKTHVYVAFIASDPNPERIRSALRERDATKEDDYVSFIVDTRGSLARKYEFRVNPHGTLSDVLQDTVSERYIYDWDTDWEGAAKIGANGYSAELAIPKTSIRAPDDYASVGHTGIAILKRSYPRRVDRTFATFFKFKRAATVQTGQVRPVEQSDEQAPAVNRLKLNPHYIYHPNEKREIGADFEQVSEHNEHEFGLDAEYNFSDSSALSVTVNPNYADVEADLAKRSINNPFNIFQPEKRRFFKSATESFNTLIPTVYTRNIVRPDWGLSYIRDDIFTSSAAFWVNDQETEVVIPDTFSSERVELLEESRSAALRLRRSKNRRSIGFIATFRDAEDYHNGVVGVDGLLDLGPDDKLRYQILYSDTQYPERFANDLCEEDDCTSVPLDEPCLLGDCPVNAQVLRTDFGNTLNGHALQIRYKHDGEDSMYWLGYEDLAADFRADLGFQRRVDVRSLNFAYGRKWYVNMFAEDEGKSRIRAYFIGTQTRSHKDDNKLESAAGLWAEFRGSYQTVFRAGYRLRRRAVNRIDQGTLATGSNAPLFSEKYFQWYFETAPRSNWKLNLDGRIGEMADAENLVLGDMLEVKPRFTYRFEHLEVALEATMRNFRVNGDSLYKERFLVLSVLYRTTRKTSHRLLFLDDLEDRDASRFLGDELDMETEQTLEYTFIYQPNPRWSILAGLKLKQKYASDIDEEDLTKREVYLKVEARI